MRRSEILTLHRSSRIAETGWKATGHDLMDTRVEHWRQYWGKADAGIAEEALRQIREEAKEELAGKCGITVSQVS